MTPNDHDLYQLAERLGQTLLDQQLCLATAESCTGGWVGKVMTDVAGSSSWYERGFITYTNQAKQDQLAVSAATLQAHGAVSEATAQAMAAGVLQFSHAQLSLAITGIAGPSGGSEQKPVGLVWFAWSRKEAQTIATSQVFKGDREAVRRQAVLYALEGVFQLL